jgi:hypothetical protein
MDLVVEAPVRSDRPLAYGRTITEWRCALRKAMPMLAQISSEDEVVSS